MNIFFKKEFYQKIIKIIRQNGLFYLAGFLTVLGMKYFYSKAGVCDLKWLLAPIVWWVSSLSGISFVYDPWEGYVSHTCQFVIAPSCSGMQFMIITAATLIFPFVHRMNTRFKKFCWTMSSLASSYILTILVNTCRIIISIYLPLYLEQKNLSGGLLTPERLHTLIGTSVYFTSLLIIYHLAGIIIHQPFFKCLPPVFFYFALVLGIPILNRACLKAPAQFAEYAVLITCVCMAVLGLFFLGSFIFYHLRVRSR